MGAWTLTLTIAIALSAASFASVAAQGESAPDSAAVHVSPAPTESTATAAPVLPAPPTPPPHPSADASGAQSGPPTLPHAPAVPASIVAPPPATHAASPAATAQSEPAADHPNPGTAFSPPARLEDLSEWLAYRTHNHIASLPQEARVFYRRGLLVGESGSREEAIRLVRGAADLDPEFVSPHLTLAGWFFFRDPSQTLLQYAAVLELVRQNFVLQLALIANSLFLALQALFLGLLAAAMIVVWLHNAELRHAWQERLGTFIATPGARIWAWSFLVLPFLLGFGLALPTIAFLGLVWPTLRARERAIFIAFVAVLAAAPWITGTLDHLSLPLRSDEGPLFGIPTLASEPYAADREQQLSELEGQHPRDPFVHFALGWEARRGGDLRVAERAYRSALELWPHNDRVMNNLANTLAMEGRADEALALYENAYGADPANAGAYFNASQILTQRFEYRAASDALSHASALNFDLVKTYQSQATEDGLLPLIDQWLAPRTFWDALPLLSVSGARRAMLPPGWRGCLECSGWGFSVAALLLAIAAVAAGLKLHRSMPLRLCSNCERVICRRCAQRRRETALCPDCATVEARAESNEFVRVLLLQRRSAVRRTVHLARTALAAVVPGYGLLALQSTVLPLLILVATAAMCGSWLGQRTPFFFEPRLLHGAHDMPVALTFGLWLAIYSISLLGYLLKDSRHQELPGAGAATSQGRSGQPPRRINAAAA